MENPTHPENATNKDMLEAGTGEMVSLSEGIRKWESLGYTENLIPAEDHLSCQMGKIELYPDDIKVDYIIRFENTSDPDDQSILYAISSPSKGVKGLYVDSYGVYHDELSPELSEKIGSFQAH